MTSKCRISLVLDQLAFVELDLEPPLPVTKELVLIAIRKIKATKVPGHGALLGKYLLLVILLYGSET